LYVPAVPGSVSIGEPAALPLLLRSVVTRDDTLVVLVESNSWKLTTPVPARLASGTNDEPSAWSDTVAPNASEVPVLPEVPPVYKVDVLSRVIVRALFPSLPPGMFVPGLEPLGSMLTLTSYVPGATDPPPYSPTFQVKLQSRATPLL
jgi:hypothetical protein